jgi:hypothetical protein
MRSLNKKQQRRHSMRSLNERQQRRHTVRSLNENLPRGKETQLMALAKPNKRKRERGAG